MVDHCLRVFILADRAGTCINCAMMTARGKDGNFSLLEWQISLRSWTYTDGVLALYYWTTGVLGLWTKSRKQLPSSGFFQCRFGPIGLLKIWPDLGNYFKSNICPKCRSKVMANKL